jgi:hypothetical protein
MPHISWAMPQVSIELALLAGRAAFLIFCFVLASITFTRWRRTARAQSEHILTQTTLFLERITAVEQRFTAVEDRFTALDGRIQIFSQTLEGATRLTTAGAGAAANYEVAIRLARSGASVEALVESCGLSRHEAQLVRRIHATAHRPPHLQAVSK